MRNLFKNTVLATLMAAGISSAMAAGGSGAQVFVHGDVKPVACTMGAGADGPKDVDLGGWAVSDFKTGTGDYANLYTVAESKQVFTVTATGCSGVGPTENGKLNLVIDESTPMRSTEKKIFGDAAKANGTTAGFTLEASDNGVDVQRLLKAGDEIVLHKFTSGEDMNAANGSSINFTTMMAADNPTPGAGHVEAPVTFSVNYK
ncbi:fimbrial protein [Enterobacter ludwigii]|uniref:fimbrial protein n=1 Tax=Enterobacter ludwigii TaxID=299767 RepID=UPI001865EA78|nr:fimbrial protein [Enterobacter ludwigii]